MLPKRRREWQRLIHVSRRNGTNEPLRREMRTRMTWPRTKAHVLTGARMRVGLASVVLVPAATLGVTSGTSPARATVSASRGRHVGSWHRRACHRRVKATSP